MRVDTEHGLAPLAALALTPYTQPCAPPPFFSLTHTHTRTHRLRRAGLPSLASLLRLHGFVLVVGLEDRVDGPNGCHVGRLVEPELGKVGVVHLGALAEEPHDPHLWLRAERRILIYRVRNGATGARSSF